MHIVFPFMDRKPVICNLHNAWIDKLCTTYNKTLGMVWKPPYPVHRYILYKLCNRAPLKEQLIWRFLKISKNMYYSDNVLTAFVASRSLFDLSWKYLWLYYV